MDMKRPTLLRKLAKLAVITHTAEPEDTPPRDCFGYSTEEENRIAVADVRERRSRSQWGWCCVLTTAAIGEFSASVALGCCSYESLDDFVACEGKQQSDEAIDALLSKLYWARSLGKKATELLRP